MAVLRCIRPRFSYTELLGAWRTNPHPWDGARGHYQARQRETVASFCACPVQVRHLRVRATNNLRPRYRNEAPTTWKWRATHKSWMLKFAHENSYLSWSRNAAICAGVGATLMIIEENLPVHEDFVMGFVDLGLVFLTFGTLQHLYSAYRLRRQLQISPLGFMWICTYASVFGLLYYFLIQSKFKIIGNGDSRLATEVGALKMEEGCSQSGPNSTT